MRILSIMHKLCDPDHQETKAGLIAGYCHSRPAEEKRGMLHDRSVCGSEAYAGMKPCGNEAYAGAKPCGGERYV